MTRYTASGSAGQQHGKTYVVLDTQDKQGGKGMRRMSFHQTFAQAQAEAKRLNAELVHTAVREAWERKAEAEREYHEWAAQQKPVSGFASPVKAWQQADEDDKRYEVVREARTALSQALIAEARGDYEKAIEALVTLQNEAT